MLRALLNLGNEHVLKPLDLKLVRRSRVLCPSDALATATSAKRIAFFHPPKCGGTSVYRSLARALGAPAGLDPVAAEAAAQNLGMTGFELREATLAYYVQRDRARFISGHYSYSRRAFAGHEDEFDLITILRNPVDRILSHYYYNRFREFDRGHFTTERDLPDWLQTNQALAAGAVFTKMFVGEPEVGKALDATGRWNGSAPAVAAAIENLRKFAIVGRLERLAEFERAIQQRYGIPMKVGHLRKSPKAGYPKFADQPAAIRDRILEICAGDIEIYDAFAKEPANSPATPELTTGATA